MGTRSTRAGSTASFHIPHKQRRSFLPGQIAVRFKPEAVQQDRTASGRRRAFGAGASPASSPTTEIIDWLTKNKGLKEIQTPFVSGASSVPIRGVRRAFGLRQAAGTSGKTAAAAASAASSVIDSPHEDLRGYTIVHVDPRVDVTKTAKELRAAKSVAIASPVAARWMLGSSISMPFRLHATPQWALDCVGFRQVRAPVRPTPVRIAVLDTGIDPKHPDLRGVSINYQHDPMRPDDLEGHGTHVAGIISAIAARKLGVFGVAQCDLDVWKVFSDKRIDGERYVDSDMYNRALGLVLDSGCKVVNLSLGGTELDLFEKALIARLIRRGVTVVAAMGNEFEEGNPVEYPAALPGVIAVGGIDQTHGRAAFSNTGKHIWVVAPAVGIRSTIPRSRKRKSPYADWDGTSFAAPLVSGAIGYLLGRRKLPQTATPSKVRSRLRVRAVRLPGMRGKRFSRQFGYGLIDLPRLCKP